jgi:hypothetical protein
LLIIFLANSYFIRSGGDTEVDVNDVSYALEKVIEQRKVEGTWQIDTFGSVSAAPIRPPDEVSMNSARDPALIRMLSGHRPMSRS